MNHFMLKNWPIILYTITIIFMMATYKTMVDRHERYIDKIMTRLEKMDKEVSYVSGWIKRDES